MEKKNLIITDMDLRGRGIGKANGKAVFVDGAVTGDTVSYDTIVSKKRYEIGRLCDITKPSPSRKAPECKDFEDCGGCSFMNVTRELELDVKLHAVESAFRRSGINGISVKEILHKNPFKYRNKAVFHRGENSKYGFFRSGTNVVYHHECCVTVPDIFNDIIRYTNAYFEDRKNLVGPDSIMLRLGDSGIMVVAQAVAYHDYDSFLSDLCDEIPEVKSAFECIGYPTDGDTKFRHVCGSESITVTFCENLYRISPRSFFQVNTEIAEMFCEEIFRTLSPAEGDLILDLYCGIGTLGLAVAKRFPMAKILGIEINDSAVSDAKANCELSDIHNAEFICADAGHADYEGLSPYALIVDPPRYGLSDCMIANILKIAPQKLIYMSCDPGTLAGNASKLIANGYTITDCIAGDMFPYAPHVETLCFFEKQGN